MKFNPKLLLILLCILNASSAIAFRVIDDRGMNLSVISPPKRIVSLLPSITETICALNKCDLLVGVDEYSNTPARAKSVPHLGGGLNPNIEMLVSLKPDLVLMSNNPQLSQRLERLGINVFVLKTVNYKDIQRALDNFDLIFQNNDGQKLWQSLESTITKTALSLPLEAKSLRVYFEVSTGPFAAGPHSFIGETLTRLGVKNIIPENLGEFPKLNPEFVVKERPDLIIVSDNHLPDLLKRPGWSHMGAILEQRICILSKEQSDIVVRPGPRMGEGAQIIAECIAAKGLKS